MLNYDSLFLKNKRHGPFVPGLWLLWGRRWWILTLIPRARYLKVIVICCTDMKSDCYEKELILNLRSLSTNIDGIAFKIYRDLTVEDKEIHGCTESKHFHISHTMDLNHFRCSFDDFRWFTRHRGPSRRLNWCRHYRSNRCMCQNVWKSISNIWFETTVRLWSMLNLPRWKLPCCICSSSRRPLYYKQAVAKVKKCCKVFISWRAEVNIDVRSCDLRIMLM